MTAAVATDITMLVHALKLTRRGFRVIRLVEAGKIAQDKGWPDLATADAKKIGPLWQQRPGANVGYTLAGLVGFDIDTIEGHGVDGPGTWAALTSGRSLPATWTVQTPSGGLQYVFALPEGCEVSSRTHALGPGVDVKSGPGAYLVGPGSCTAVGVYEQVDDTGPSPLPEFLVDELRHAGLIKDSTLDTRVQPGEPCSFDDPDEPWSPLGRFGEPIPEGQRADTMFRYASSLRARRSSFAEAERLIRDRFADCAQPAGRPFTWGEARQALISAWSRYPSGSSAASGAARGRAEGEGPPVAGSAAFYGVLGEAVRAGEPHTEADPVGVLASLLAGVGVLLGPGPHVQVGAVRHPLLVWPLLFGLTGSGRKGEATEQARLFLLSSYPELAGLAVTGLSSGEGLIERIRDTEDENDDSGRENKRLLVTEPEFSTVMARARREGSTLAAVLRQAWDGRALSVLNRSALHASSSHVAIVAHVTPREFRTRLAESEMAGGTYNRFLPLYVERSKRLPIPDPIPDATIHTVAQPLAEAVQDERYRGAVRIELDRQAREWWTQYVYDELTLTDDEDTAAAEFTRRAAPYCLRIAALHAVVNGASTVDVDHLEAALSLVRYSIASARHVLAGQSADPRLDRIRRALNQATDGLTRTEISALFSRNLPAAVLDELLAQLAATGNYYSEDVSTTGRPATRWYRRAQS